MAFAANARSDAMLAGINITPLVDVLLVLLIIFMVSAPLLSRTLALDLPAPVPDPPEPPATLRLAIGGDGSLRLGGFPVTAPMLRNALVAARGDDPHIALEIAAAGEVEYAPVARALADARAAGIASVGFAVD